MGGHDRTPGLTERGITLAHAKADQRAAVAAYLRHESGKAFWAAQCPLTAPDTAANLITYSEASRAQAQRIEATL